ncbi:MAG: dihydropteroate synthase [Gemmatimonadetes bacterium]|nr:dihydropteroate synthase [Gemmatimonadota bacterium]
MIWELGSRTLHFVDQVQIMGVLNATPDSFYDGGRYCEPQAAVERGLAMVEEGAAVVDIGGESSRPPMYGVAEEVSVAEECARVLPVIEGLRRQSDVPISIDTVKAEVAHQALEAGADIINDISALRHDPAMAEVAARAKTPVVLMHRRGTAATMQQNTHYDDLLGKVYAFLQERVRVAHAQGVERVAVDPGLGFGKSREGNLALLRMLDRFLDLECPLVVGASRKSFIWKTLGLSAAESLEGSLAAAALAARAGVHVLRVHDVAATLRAVRLVEAVRGQAPC